MKITLYHRHIGAHTPVKEAQIKGRFSDYARTIQRSDDYKVDEEKLLANLPKGFLPTEPGKILLVIDDDHGGTGQRGLTRFRNWAKYFDSYSLGLWRGKQPT